MSNQESKVARVFNTSVEEMKATGLAANDDSECTEVMAPVAHSDRSPVLLLMEGGYGSWQKHRAQGHTQRVSNSSF